MKAASRFLAVLVPVLTLGLLWSGRDAVRGWSAGTFPGTVNHHGQLAVHAAECMRDKSKLVAPGCRSEAVVNPAFLFGELIRGSQEPDFRAIGDGVSSSKHSLNPRFGGLERNRCQE